MTLYEGIRGAVYQVKGVFVEEAATRRLQALGINDGTCIRILNRKKRGAMIIQVRGTRLALGRHISSCIEVEEETEEIKETDREDTHDRR